MPAIEQRAYVQFETRAVEDREATMREGRYMAKDVDFAIIVPPGDSKTVLEQEVTDLHKKRYKNEYEAFKEGREMPLNGTSVKDWGPASPAIAKNLISAGVRTVEDLANANESTLEKIGMGSRPLKEKARAWLEASSGPGKLAEEMVGMKARMDDMEMGNMEKDDLISKLKSENDALKKKKR